MSTSAADPIPAMQRAGRAAFTLIELLVMIAVIAIIAAILFPVFAMAREKARMSACVSNMRQIGAALMLYAQDYDETFPYIRFHGESTCQKGARCYVWKNAIRPYLRSVDAFACPSNPYSRTEPGLYADPPKRGTNAEGWELEPEQRMPISYGMNSCATSWIPADFKSPVPAPPLRVAEVVRPADTILIAEMQAHPWSDVNAGGLFANPFGGDCDGVFAHPAGKVGNFIFYDGHVKSKKWLKTLYPVNENNWELSPNPDPNNRKLNAAPGCADPTGGTQSIVPAGPDAKEFQTKACQAYQ